jgi:hypothetical protein
LGSLLLDDRAFIDDADDENKEVLEEYAKEKQV